VTEVTSPEGRLFYVSMSLNGSVHLHNHDGTASFYGNSDKQLIPYEPYSDYKNGDEVYAHDGDNPIPAAAYFFGLDGEGRPLTYPRGTSPFTYVEEDGVVRTWDYCEKAKKEDK
jgi:hypothetical protein